MSARGDEDVAAASGAERAADGSWLPGTRHGAGLEDDYATGMWFSNRLPEEVASAVIERCSQIRATRHRDLQAFDLRQSARAPD